MLETERLILRQFKEWDLDDLFEIVSNIKICSMSGWYFIEDIQSAKFLLNKIIQNPLHFAIVLKENNKVVGAIELMDYDEKSYIGVNILHGAKEIAFLLYEKYWGKGIMKEALEIILDYAFNTLKIPQILAGNYADNAQSHRLQDKLGIKIVGEINKYKVLENTHKKFFQRSITLSEFNLQK